MECIFIEITVTDVGSNGNILVGLLYRPPSQSLVSFYEQLTQLMTKVTREKKKCYFMGDFNINITMNEHNNNTCTLLDIMYSMSFIPLITRPTRITSTSATFIDNIFCTILLNNNTRVNGVLYTDISDHLPVFTISECTQKRHGKGSRIINTRSFSGQNVCLFKALVGSIDWAPVLSQVDTQQSYSIFVDLINTAYDEAFPIRRKFIKNARSNPWITKSLKKCIKVKNKLYVLYKNKNSVYNEIKYKSYKNELQNVIRNAKKLYYGTKIEENKTNLSKSWKILKELVTSNERVQCNTEFVDGEVCVDNMQQVVNKFNDCFVNLGPRLAEKIPLQSVQPREYLKGDYLSTT